MEATLRNLETQIGQIATASHTRIPNAIPSDTVPNPKGFEQCKAVKLRSGKDLESPIMLDAQNGSNILHAGADKLFGSQTSHAGADEGIEWATTEARECQQEKEESTMSDIHKKNPLSPAMDPKKVNVDVSLVDLFLHFPKFSKFFKDLIAKKEKIQDDGVVRLSAFCSQLVKGKIPAKRRDPGSCVIPCEMGDKKFPKCLLDQGSGISLMALKTARSIGLQARIESIDIELQLADHSIVKPLGIIKDVLVKVDKFVLPVDFIVLEMEEDKDMPILFGRPFLATGDVVIETKTNTVMFRVDGENVVIKQEKAGKRLLEPG
ncbi:uncharacterized protein LOC121766723 [Salvia splendens]|uniref:uncharacterized protein LOC121766723 n=1 Tax=Salvia splendens TaxID=180675 RepID=UPI001C2687DC|nr:uncharacterized protein LOC121766723 [Salvia splendens]